MRHLIDKLNSMADLAESAQSGSKEVRYLSDLNKRLSSHGEALFAMRNGLEEDDEELADLQKTAAFKGVAGAMSNARGRLVDAMRAADQMAQAMTDVRAALVAALNELRD